MDVKPLVDELNKMILEGRALEAFDKFYAEDVVMQENEQPPRVGKEANRAYEEEFFKGVIAFHAAEIRGVAYGDNISMVEWFMDIEHSAWGRGHRSQVAVQRWNNGKIVSEKFYYHAA